MQTVTSISAATFTPRFLQHEGRASAAWTAADLAADSKSHRGTGGVSEENEGFGFRPAFLDAGTGIVYRSRFPGRHSGALPPSRRSACLKNWWRVATSAAGSPPSKRSSSRALSVSGGSTPGMRRPLRSARPCPPPDRARRDSSVGR